MTSMKVLNKIIFKEILKGIEIKETAMQWKTFVSKIKQICV